MFVNNIEDKDALHMAVLKELRDHGIKYPKPKKRQAGQDKSCGNKIFHTPLHQLKLADVFLVSGSIVQVPQFVSDACQRILEQVTTEGLFRKAGSAARQRSIRGMLEKGKCLDKSHHAIDVANLLKGFFRDLPEALLPSGVTQDSMLRCLFTKDQKLNTLLLICLLLPPLTLNLLAFFMQFLHTVSLHSDQNRMTIENLAIIFVPGLIHPPEMYPTRVPNYVKILTMLIENADRIGIVPERFLASPRPNRDAEKEEKKRKKRRSGSLTRVFNGLKKIVGVRGSADDLDKSAEHPGVTPCLTKSGKKRKAGEQNGMSAKKKKQIIALMPNGSLLPNTPMLVKENKKLRLSFGSSRRISKFAGVEPPETIAESHIELPQMERRWSVVGTPIKKGPTEEFDGDATKYFSPVVSLPCLNFTETSQDVTCEEDKDYVKVSKSEYQALNERVAAIEARISEGFLPESLPADPELVQDVYEQTLEDTESISQPGTEELARRLSRDLKIRRSGDRRIFRSPSARKIGTIRRRSRESAKLTRTKSWHVGGSADVDFSFYPKTALKRGRPNTVQTGLRHPSPAPRNPPDSQEGDQEMWTSAEDFFQPATDEEKIVFITEKRKEINPEVVERRQSLRSAVKTEEDSSPRFKTKITVKDDTPMLPPRGVAPKRTPRFPKTPFEQHQQMAPTGRASIARLRSQNAGMVAEKAKLFNGLSDETENATPKRGGQRFRLREVNETFLKPPVIRPALMENTPRRIVKVPPRNSPNTPMKAFRANSRSPRVPRNYRSPRH